MLSDSIKSNPSKSGFIGEIITYEKEYIIQIEQMMIFQESLSQSDSLGLCIPQDVTKQLHRCEIFTWMWCSRGQHVRGCGEGWEGLRKFLNLYLFMGIHKKSRYE